MTTRNKADDFVNVVHDNIHESFFALFDPVAEDDIYKRTSQRLLFRKYNSFQFLPHRIFKNKY